MGRQLGSYMIQALIGAGGMGRCIAGRTHVWIGASPSRCCDLMHRRALTDADDSSGRHVRLHA